MILLLESAAETNHQDFQLLLENQKEEPTIRYLAALSLGKMNTAEAQNILVKNLNVDNEQVLTGILLALGRSGKSDSIDSILKVISRTQRFLRSQAEFAAQLISYRYGLNGNDLPIPREEDYSHLPDDVQQMQISVPTPQELQKCMAAIVDKQYGIRYAEKPAYQLNYDRGVGIILFNKELIDRGDLRILSERKLLLGVFADKFEEFDSYSIAYLIFTCPIRQVEGINILVTTPQGKLVFGGKANFETDNNKFIIRSISQKGVFPLYIEGMIKDNTLTLISSQFSTIIHDKDKPVPSNN